MQKPAQISQQNTLAGFLNVVKKKKKKVIFCDASPWQSVWAV